MSNPIHAQLFEITANKSQRTQIAIAEAAVQSYVKRGIEASTYGDIAKIAGLSRTIVLRYFPEHKDLLLFMAKYVRANYQQFVFQRFIKEKGTVNQVRTYLLAAMDWVDEFPDHAHAWLLFFYYCGIKKEFRKMNTELVKVGFERLRALIQQGSEERVFKVKDMGKVARQVHLTLSGAILALMTEDASFNAKIKRDTLEFCLLAMGADLRER